VLNDPKKSAEEKFAHARKLADEYFDIPSFDEFCEENFKGIEDRMIEFYDQHFDSIIKHAIQMSDFPDHEKEKFYKHYKQMMEDTFRPNAKDYLTSVIYTREKASSKK